MNNIREVFRKILLGIFCLLISVSYGHGQCPWIDAQYRNTHYPNNEYYVSYYYLINDNNKLAECIQKVNLIAQNQLANNICSEVSSYSRNSILAINSDGNYSEEETFLNEFTSSASAHLINIHTEHCYEKQNNTVHALAYVNKSELSDFCDMMLQTNIATIKERINSINDLVSQGYKSEARKILDETLPIIYSSPVYLSQLIAIGRASNPIEYTADLENLSMQLSKLNSELDRPIAIFITAKENTLDGIKASIDNRCRGVLSDYGCHFLDDIDNADYVIEIECSTRTSSRTDVGWFAFADSSIKITRSRDKMVLYDDMISTKGGGADIDRAHRKAIDQSISEICNKIINNIKD